ncbi:hypothetical protein UFVDC4_00213 [Staphylococcus phage vB_SauM-UFV_DC4]|nr:hypothetical protein UFVDC4_00213 [Staphylococcus phage vB_SauM-UFV_DC4]BDE75791.1 hypothetical protein [Staphylococcus phage S6]
MYEVNKKFKYAKRDKEFTLFHHKSKEKITDSFIINNYISYVLYQCYERTPGNAEVWLEINDINNIKGDFLFKFMFDNRPSFGSNYFPKCKLNIQDNSDNNIVTIEFSDKYKRHNFILEEISKFNNVHINFYEEVLFTNEDEEFKLLKNVFKTDNIKYYQNKDLISYISDKEARKILVKENFK